jgi:alkylation response protein AidB-like acyl-CoA dehydrogenase
MSKLDHIPSPALSDDLLDSLRSEFAATAAHHDETADFPYRNFKRLGELGLLALTVPTSHGGFGGGLVEACRLVGAVGGGEASTGLLLAMNLLMHHVLDRSRPAAFDEIAHAAVEGNGILNALQAEPDLGSALRGGLPGTVASRLADGRWCVNGRKAYATGSPVVQWWLLFARTDETESRVGTWLLPSDTPGLQVVPTWNHMGLRATASHELKLDNVVLAPEALLGSLHAPGSPEFKARNAVVQVWNGLLLAALYDGIARAGRDWLYGFLHDRKPSGLGASLATVPRLQGVAGEIESLLLVNRTLLDDAARKADAAKQPEPALPTLVKHLVTTNAIRVLELALSVTGNHGLDRANPLERHYRDALCGRVHAPQSDTILLNVGKAALGVN